MDVTKIPFNELLGIEKDKSPGDALLVLNTANNYKNHLDTVHASAQFSLGEAASGEFLLQCFKELAEKETIIPVLRKADVKYKKPVQGTIKAYAEMREDIKEQTITSIEKRRRAIAPVKVTVTDSNDVAAMTATYEWFVQKMDSQNL